MDQISVTEEALQNSYCALRDLSENTDSITRICIDNLSGQLNNLDLNLRKDIEKYIELLMQLNKNEKKCIEENMNAILERKNKIPFYESQAYRLRNLD